MIPTTTNQFKPHKKAFSTWLQGRGAVIHEPTNPYEVLRFDAVNGIALVYRKKDGSLTWTGNAMAAWQAFRAGKDTGGRRRRWPGRTRERAGALLPFAASPTGTV